MAFEKQDAKNLAFIFGGVGVLVASFYLIPSGSTGQTLMAIFMMILFGGALLWFTELGNPIKNLIRKLQNKK